MISPEVFYIHIKGEQRGPYTLTQIDHLLNSGLIAAETLYWREGLEQWQPVTSLVVVRKEANRWIRPAVVLAVLIFLAALVRFFGPITMQGWREANQHEFVETAAYWWARGVVRETAVPTGALVEFAPFSEADVQMDPPQGAQVLLRGELTDSSGQTKAAAWKVKLLFDHRRRAWAHDGAAEMVASL